MFLLVPITLASGVVAVYTHSICVWGTTVIGGAILVYDAINQLSNIKRK
jgi:hypothetical protein